MPLPMAPCAGLTLLLSEGANFLGRLAHALSKAAEVRAERPSRGRERMGNVGGNSANHEADKQRDENTDGAPR